MEFNLMPYVTRNNKGEIVTIHQNKNDEGAQWLEENDSEITTFINNAAVTPNKVKKALTGSDNEMARVIEDLVDLLMEKQIFVYTELPEAVQAKLNVRKQLRQDMSSLENLIDEDDAIF